MGEGIKKSLAVTGVITLVILVVLIAGAIDVIQRGGGFLFIASFTPSPTNTATLTETPTNTMTSTATETFTPTFTATMVPSATFTNVPTSTHTAVPTFDVTALAYQIYNDVTRTYESYLIQQTPSVTPTISSAELYTGLKMINAIDGKEMLYVKNEDQPDCYGFWIDKNEVSNKEYANCIHAGVCTPPGIVFCMEKPYFNNKEYNNFPVVNITFAQAMNYCSWVGMRLMTYEEWKYASEQIQSNSDNVDDPLSGPEENYLEDMNLVGNVWEWISDQNLDGYNCMAGGSWKTSIHDINNFRTACMRYGDYAEDVGFRCILPVFK